MLKKLVEIDHKCFKQFKWGALPELARFNLFYGWNGTGKTTLSNLLADIDQKAPIGIGKVVFRIDNMNVQGDQLGQDDQSLPRIRVFNQRYVESSIFSRFDNLDHIVFFGEKTVEHEQQRKAAVDEQAKLRDEYKELSPKKAKAAKELDAYKQDQAQAIKTLLRTAGQDKYTNYNKSHFETRCDSFNPEIDIVLSDHEKAALVATIRTDIRPTLQTQKSINPVSSSLLETIRLILAASPTNVAIESLKNDSQLAGWVGQGLQLHQHRDVKTCLFCENPLGEDRIKRLEQHFDDSFRVLSQQLTDSLQSIQRLRSSANDFKPYQTTSVYPQLAEQLKALNVALETRQTEFLKSIQVVEDSLNAKRSNIFMAAEAPPELANLLSKGEVLCDSANEIQTLLAEHNRITNNFNTQIGQAKGKLESDFIASSIATNKEKNELARSTSESLDKCRTRGLELTAIIKKLDEELTETAAPAESLNQDLALYLGHSELTLTHHGNGYAITRGNEEARDLSEGEKTAFALLYFLKSLEDHRGKLEETIVVIDDPVSSLDASALFTAFGLIKERTEKARQIIVLTHDFTFFNLVKGWFRLFDKQNQSRYYSLISLMNDGGKSNAIIVMDRLIKDFGSEYQYLFCLVKKGATAQGKELSELYGLPNVGRRLLEHFIAFKFPGGIETEKLIERMKKLELDPSTLAVLNRFLNIYSHGDDMASSGHDLNLLAETPKVMQAILTVMRTEDKDHVERLEAAIQG
ncbi:MAG: AAA family ATPase [Polaromonas sp.]|uniref:AAA family ATPase n=1 Tax=Polaromonas sp. TaxID=1869339 RepID=UPI0027364669|nr:AAA family ATPase [Polaromonas sp.]MDP2818136.1 AAA family ATPase [Polaromonas sp.]